MAIAIVLPQQKVAVFEENRYFELGSPGLALTSYVAYSTKITPLEVEGRRFLARGNFGVLAKDMPKISV